VQDVVRRDGLLFMKATRQKNAMFVCYVTVVDVTLGGEGAAYKTSSRLLQSGTFGVNACLLYYIVTLRYNIVTLRYNLCVWLPQP
jgi:hypothetical protein